MRSALLAVIACLVFLVYPLEASAAFLRQGIGAHSIRWYHASPGAAVRWNPALLTSVQSLVAECGHSRLFGLPLLTNQEAYIAVATSAGRYGLGYSQFGGVPYREQTVSLLWGKRLLPRCDIGVSLHGFQLSIPTYGRGHTIGLDIGTRWRLSGEVTWDITYLNINHPAIGQTDDPLPQQANMALIFRPVPFLGSAVYLMHELGFAPRYGLMLRYRAVHWCIAGVSAQNAPGQLGLDVALQWKTLRIRYEISTHTVLAPTHWIRLSIGR